MKTEYVVGFLFNRQLSQVVLVKKRRPDWMAGRLNGPGGKIEEGETPEQAMGREFSEEARWVEHPGDYLTDSWVKFVVLGGEDAGYVVHFFYEVVDKVRGIRAEVGCDEDVFPYHVETVLALPESETIRIVPNLRWLIPMALTHWINSNQAVHTLQVGRDPIVKIIEDYSSTRPELETSLPTHCTYPKPCGTCNPIMKKIPTAPGCFGPCAGGCHQDGFPCGASCATGKCAEP